jgi:hypothetical protein
MSATFYRLTEPVRVEVRDSIAIGDLDEYAQHTEREDGSHAGIYLVVSVEGTRIYVADDFDHAREQHNDGFPEEGEAYVVLQLSAGTTE